MIIYHFQPSDILTDSFAVQRAFAIGVPPPKGMLCAFAELKNGVVFPSAGMPNMIYVSSYSLFKLPHIQGLVHSRLAWEVET
jgi:hypothetical protein